MNKINDFKAGCSYLVARHSFARLEVDKKIGRTEHASTIAISYIDKDYIIEKNMGSPDYIFFILNIKLPEFIE
jgi:hypothetical protein